MDRLGPFSIHWMHLQNWSHYLSLWMYSSSSSKKVLIFLIYHQLLELPRYLGKDPIWKDCLIYVLLYLISMKKFHDWMLLQHLKYHLLSLLQQLHVYQWCYFRRSGFSYPLDPYICCNSTTAIIFLFLIQLEDIISSFDVTVISAFTTLSWSLFLNSGSSSFTGLIDWLSHNHVFPEDQRKAGPLNHLCILLKFFVFYSGPWGASSAGLSCVDTYCHCWTSVWSQINCIRFIVNVA